MPVPVRRPKSVRGSISSAVERRILSDPNLEDWYREKLLTEARSLAVYYAGSG